MTRCVAKDFPDEHIPGSFGHPELCRRPCILFATGRCAPGYRCKYCHEPHDKHVKMQKSTRIALHKLGATHRLQLLHEHLARKRYSIPAHLPRLDHLIRLVEEELARLSPQEPSVSSLLRRRTWLALLELPVAAVLGEIVTSPTKLALHASLQAELKWLRLQCALGRTYPHSGSPP